MEWRKEEQISKKLGIKTQQHNNLKEQQQQQQQ